MSLVVWIFFANFALQKRDIVISYNTAV